MRIVLIQLYLLHCFIKGSPAVNTWMLSLRRFLVEGLSLGPNDCMKKFQNCFSVKELLLFRLQYMRLQNNLSEIGTPANLYWKTITRIFWTFVQIFGTNVNPCTKKFSQFWTWTSMYLHVFPMYFMWVFNGTFFQKSNSMYFCDAAEI